MRRPHRLLLILAALAGLAGGCQIRKPTIGLQEVHLRSQGLQSIRVGVSFVVDNPNSFALKVADVRCRLKVANEDLLSARAEGRQQYAPARGTCRVDAATDVEYARLVRAWTHYQWAPSLPYRFDVSGDFYLGLLPVPVSVGRTRELKHGGGKSLWHLRALRFPGGGKVEIVFGVTNSGDREMPVPGLAGQVTCNGTVLLAVERPEVKTVPPKQTLDVGYPVRLKASAMAKSLGSALLGSEPVLLEGHFRLDPPLSVVK